MIKILHRFTGSLAVVVLAFSISSAARTDAAAQVCPALPDAQSTFGAALTNLIGKLTGGGTSAATAGDPVKLLNASQNQKVLEWVRNELVGRENAFGADYDAKAASQRLENLKRRIFVIDRTERDPLLQRGRLFDQKDGKVTLSSGKPKLLSQIIKEEMARVKPTLASKYSTKYGKAIADAFKANPAQFGQTAGALAGGDYKAVLDQAADWGATGFGAVVSDVLSEMGLDSTKTVWDKAITKSGAAKNILIALNQGNPDAAWAEIVKEYKAEVKTQARAAVKVAINMVFDAGSGAGSIGDFLPNPGNLQRSLAPGLFGLTPGDLYLKLLDAEVQFINWGKTYIREKSEFGDGACIRLYEEIYRQTGSAGAAYERFADCIPTAKFSAMMEFGNQARSVGLNETALIKAFLEARRTRRTTAWTPLEWIAKKVAARKKQLQRGMLPELSRAEKVMATIATRVGRATQNRLTELAAAALNERQWDQLEDEVRQLEKTLSQTLAIIQGDLARIRRYSDGIGEACTAYDREKLVARQALSQGSTLSVTASRLWDRLDGVNTAACQRPEPGANADPAAAQRAALAAAIKADGQVLAAERQKVCAAPADIRDASDKQSARSRLDDALQSAREVQVIATRIKGAAAELATLTAPQATPDAGAAARDKAIADIDAIRGEIEAVAGQFGTVEGQFRTAHDAMNAAQRRVDRLTPGTGEIIERIRACLRPLAAAPVAREPRRLLEELTQRSTNNFGCRGVVLESWNERDLDPPSGTGVLSSTPWRRRSLSLSHSVEQLRGKLAEKAAKCPQVESPSVLPVADGDGGELDSQAVIAAADAEISQMQTCVAQALTAYNDGWGAGKIAAGPTCNVATNATELSKLKAGLQDGTATQTQVTEFEGIAGLVRVAHASYSAAKAAYSAGDIPATKAKLNEAKATIAAMGGTPSCAELSGKIDRGLARADRLERVLARARAALGSCDMAELRAVRDTLQGTSHRELKALAAQANRVLLAQAKFGAASAAYSRGALSAAKSDLRQAKALLAQNPAGANCTDLARRIDEGLRRVTKLQNAIRTANRAINACDIDAIKQSKVTLGRTSNPAADNVKGRFDAAIKKCQKREREQIAADRNAGCAKDYGRGYYAGKSDRNGKYFCLPTQRTANAWCNANNKGSGWRARNIRRDGRFDCQLTPRARTNQAWADCRRQFGNRLINVKFLRNGTYQCIYRTQRAQPRHDTRSSAAAAAAAAAAIQGIIDRNRRRPRATPPPRTTRPAPRVRPTPRAPRGPTDHCKNMSIGGC